MWVPELHRLHGDFELAWGDDRTVASIAYQEGIDAARTMNAKSYELRAATSLGRLWQSQARTK